MKKPIKSMFIVAMLVILLGAPVYADPGLWCEPVDGNTIWTPGGARVFHTHTDSPASLSLVMKNDASVAADPIVDLQIDMPKGARVSQAFALIPEMYQNHLQWISQPLTVKIAANGSTVRYSFEELGGNKPPEWATVVLCFEPNNKQMKNAQVSWRTIRKSGAITDGESFTVKFLSPMPKSARPKRMGETMLFYTFDFQFPDANAFGRALKKYDAANIGGRWAVKGKPERKFSPAWFDKILVERGWPVFPVIGAESPIDWQPRVSFPLPSGAKRAQTLDGTTLVCNGFQPLCPQYVKHDPEYRKAYRAWVKGYDAVYSGKHVMIDIEPFKSPNQACFCDDCVTDFAKFAKLDAAQLIADKQSIIIKHRGEWSLYQSRVETDAIAWVAKLCKEFWPQAKLSYYCHLIDWEKVDLPKYFSTSRLDPRVMDKVVDIHAPSFYGLENADAVELFEAFQKKLSKEQRPFLSISRAIGPEAWYTTREGTSSPEGLRVKMVALAASGARGFYIYPGNAMDGLYFDAMRRAQADLAKAEGFYLDGKKSPVSGSASHLRNGGKYIVVRGHKLKGETLVTIVNFHPSETAFVKIDWPGAPTKFKAADLGARILLNGKSAWSRATFAKNFMVEVPPCGVKLLVLNPSASRVAGWPSRSVELTRKKYAATVGGSAAAMEKMRREIKTIDDDWNRGGLSLATIGASLHQLRLSSENGLVVMESPRQKLWINPADGGRIVKWQNKAADIQILPNADQGKYWPSAENAAWDCFWMPLEWRYYSDNSAWGYQVKEALINEQGVAVVKLALLVPSRNVYLEKTYRMRAGDDALDVEISVCNAGEVPLEFNFWVRHNPKLGIDPQRTSILVPAASGLADARTASKSEPWNALYSADMNAMRAEFDFKPGTMTEADVFGSATEGKMVARRADGKASLVAEMEFDKLLALYRIPAGGDTWSMEWIYRRANLQPLQSWQTSYRLSFLVESSK
jgi:hypothetical protein